MELFGVGPLEALLVGVITFILVGPDRFPELARQAGRWYRVARAFSAEVMADFQGAVKEIEAEVDVTTGGGIRSIRELAQSSASILTEARADLQAAASSAQASIETPTVETPPAAGLESAPSDAEATPSEAIPLAEQEAPPSEAIPVAEQQTPAPVTAPAVTAVSNGARAHHDAADDAEARRREAAAREAAARITGGSA
ncbi:MAG: hypothetical protein EPO16_02505 [Dehalococcoidia bacterium]|nr:MAG: hypothetical protein EPO16_02505 [Dehalococcoidia bacterium]